MIMRLLIIDDHDLVRDALQARLEAIPGYEVVGSVSDGEQALAILDKAKPDVAIIDFRMPRMNGAECAKRIKERLPSCQVLFLTGFPDDEALVDPNLVPAIMTRAAAAEQHQLALREIDPDRVLTPTEGRVSLLAAEGLSNQGIAARLSMSENTVKAHLQRVFRKLGIHSREELAARVRS